MLAQTFIDQRFALQGQKIGEFIDQQTLTRPNNRNEVLKLISSTFRDYVGNARVVAYSWLLQGLDQCPMRGQAWTVQKSITSTGKTLMAGDRFNNTDFG